MRSHLADKNEMVSSVLRADGSGVSLTSSGTLVRLQIRQLGVYAAIVVVVVVVVVVVGGHRRSGSSSLAVSGLEVRRGSSLELDVRRKAVNPVAQARVQVERKTLRDQS